jgi:DNA-directed RNA polymerase subunit RPC12/RpoP
MIRFRCPACNKALKVRESLAGKLVTCPRCHEQPMAPALPPDPKPDSPDETPGWFSTMSPELRWTVASVAVAGCLGLLAAVVGAALSGGTWITHGAMVVTIGSALGLLTIFYGHATGCPRCGRWWSRTMVKSEPAAREIINRDGTTFGRSATRTEYKCAGCGHSWAVTDSEEYPVQERSQPGRIRS